MSCFSKSRLRNVGAGPDGVGDVWQQDARSGAEVEDALARGDATEAHEAVELVWRGEAVAAVPVGGYGVEEVEFLCCHTC